MPSRPAELILFSRDHARAVRWLHAEHLTFDRWKSERDADIETVYNRVGIWLRKFLTPQAASMGAPLPSLVEQKSFTHLALLAGFEPQDDANGLPPAAVQEPALCAADLGNLRPVPADIAKFGYYVVQGSVNLDTLHRNFEERITAAASRPDWGDMLRGISSSRSSVVGLPTPAGSGLRPSTLPPGLSYPQLPDKPWQEPLDSDHS